jgi:hypothetical protein
MQTVNFQCGHCGNLMAVGEEFLGQQVRCPHCQQVVQAPAPTAPPPPEAPAPPPDGAAAPTTDFPLPPPPEAAESIFSPPEESGEDLFGAPAGSRVELPAEPAWPHPTPDQPAPPSDPAPTTPVAPEAGAAGAVPWLDAPAEAPPGAPAESAGDFPAIPAPAVRPARGGGWVTVLVIVPLISYSLLATIAIVLLLTRPAPRHPLEVLPDIEGEGKGATHVKGHSLRIPMPDPDPKFSPLPPHLRVGLRKALTVGDLEVTPLRVARRRVRILTEGSKPETCEVLALTLHLRNVSADVAFKPLDPYFTRSYDPQKPGGATMPYTVLLMGLRRFFGGPIAWGRRPKETVEKQDLDRELMPGDEMETFVCTNPEDGAAAALEHYQGPLTWRVQLRRGLVRWRTAKGVTREDPATADVGVDFTAAEVQGDAS